MHVQNSPVRGQKAGLKSEMLWMLWVLTLGLWGWCLICALVRFGGVLVCFSWVFLFWFLLLLGVVVVFGLFSFNTASAYLQQLFRSKCFTAPYPGILSYCPHFHFFICCAPACACPCSVPVLILHPHTLSLVETFHTFLHLKIIPVPYLIWETHLSFLVAVVCCQFNCNVFYLSFCTVEEMEKKSTSVCFLDRAVKCKYHYLYFSNNL